MWVAGRKWSTEQGSTAAVVTTVQGVSAKETCSSSRKEGLRVGDGEVGSHEQYHKPQVHRIDRTCHLMRARCCWPSRNLEIAVIH